MSKRALYRLIWVPSAVALVAILVILPGYTPAMSAPGPMTAFTTGDKVISLQRPNNWEPHEQATHGVLTEVRFTPSKDVFMRVTVDLAGSLMADMDRATSNAADSLGGMMGATGGGERKTPLEKAHEKTADALGEDLSEFKEGVTRPIQVAGSEALATDFTYQKVSDFGSKEHKGRFITALTTQSRLTIVYHCLSDSGTSGKLLPVFEEIVKSLRLGEGQ